MTEVKTEIEHLFPHVEMIDEIMLDISSNFEKKTDAYLAQYPDIKPLSSDEQLEIQGKYFHELRVGIISCETIISK